MGNIFSNEEKLLRHQRNQIILGRNTRKIYGIYEQYGNHQTNHLYVRQNEHRYRRRRNVSFHGRYGRNEYLKAKSHSLNAILEELYTFGPENFTTASAAEEEDEEEEEEEEETKFKFETNGPLIPRIKLRRSTSSLKEEKNYKTLCKMSSQSEIIIGGDSTDSSLSSLLKKENTDVNANRPEKTVTILLNDEKYDEISTKSDENYFTKNFDDCMKRLQQIEKEHELIENEDKDVQFCILQKEKEKTHNGSDKTVYDYKSGYEFKEMNEKDRKDESEDLGKQKSESVTTTQTENCTTESQTPSTGWYSSLKQQFEKPEQENQEPKTKEMSCRITGATLKNTQNEKIKPEEKEKETRHYYSSLFKTTSLIDEELPDPDKVRNIRTMFQETLNSTLKRKMDKKLGGSLQNISYKDGQEQQMNRPLSVQCCRNEIFCETRHQRPDDDKKDVSRPLRDINGEFQIENAKKKLFEKYERDLKGKDCRNKRILQPKWTDTGSVSSGISSDLSSYDTDLESYSREGTEQDEMTVSDDDLLEEVKDKHYVQNEVLEKIRSFGTSVTYYGGEMITCSIGPLLSPTTQAIMEEIGEKCGSETSPIRSFDEFYRKYIETNEYNRKKKLGRTRSFGQNDVFQKPNVLNNTEIELYKNDLEIELGIKKPMGIPQNSLKRKVTKSASLGSKMDTIEKIEEKHSEVVAATDVINSPKEEEETLKEDLPSECDTINKTVTEETFPVTNSNEEVKEEVKNHNDILEDKKNVEEETKPLKPLEKERLYLRSKSAPESLPETKNKYDFVTNNIENPAKDIIFSYEKSIFNKKCNSDMEFEEFEVCESLSEKLEKLEKINSQDKAAAATTTDEGTSNNDLQNQIDENSKLVLNAPKSEMPNPETETKSENNQMEKKETKYNSTKWPIETSVMVDIQKNSEQTPKIISTGKTLAKTKIRLF